LWQRRAQGFRALRTASTSAFQHAPADAFAGQLVSK
jgi:hypothetical protein